MALWKGLRGLECILLLGVLVGKKPGGVVPSQQKNRMAGIAHRADVGSRLGSQIDKTIFFCYYSTLAIQRFRRLLVIIIRPAFNPFQSKKRYDHLF
jgi:hypothetical protein